MVVFILQGVTTFFNKGLDACMDSYCSFHPERASGSSSRYLVEKKKKPELNRPLIMNDTGQIPLLVVVFKH